MNLLWESEKIKLHYNYGLKINLIYKQENFNVQSVYLQKEEYMAENNFPHDLRSTWWKATKKISSHYGKFHCITF